MRRLFIAVAILALAAPVSGQMVDRAELESISRVNALGVNPVDKPFSLIDLSRLQWSHSYSLSYVSGGAYSGSTGILNTSMFYEFSPKLSLLLNIGIAHNAGVIWGDGNNAASVLPGFVLDYHPSDKFQMTIGVQTIRGDAYNPYYYRSSLFRPGYLSAF